MNSDIDSWLAGRYFGIFEFRPSFSQVIIRSQKGYPPWDTIDLLFIDVRFMQIPMVFDDVQLEKATPEEVESIKPLIPYFDEREVINFYAIISKKVRYFIAAWRFGIYIHDNDFDYRLPFDSQSVPFTWKDWE